MIKAISLEATLALGGGRSAFSRSAARADPRGSAAEVADTAVGKAVSRRRQT